MPRPRPASPAPLAAAATLAPSLLRTSPPRLSHPAPAAAGLLGLRASGPAAGQPWRVDPECPRVAAATTAATEATLPRRGCKHRPTLPAKHRNQVQPTPHNPQRSTVVQRPGKRRTARTWLLANLAAPAILQACAHTPGLILPRGPPSAGHALLRKARHEVSKPSLHRGKWLHWRPDVQPQQRRHVHTRPSNADEPKHSKAAKCAKRHCSTKQLLDDRPQPS